MGTGPGRMPPPSTLTFLGAAGTVTGSKALVEAEGHEVLVDCGLFQGLRRLRRRNWAAFPVPAASIEAVALTHAHLDHCGYLPALVRKGFRGRVLCTEGTAALAEIVLRDSARLQEEDSRWAGAHGTSRHRPPRALYTTADAEESLRLFETVPFGVDSALAGPLHVRFEPAGHILGSSVVHVTDGRARAVFSGDLGRPHHPLLVPPAPLGAADVVVVESTYGDREHAPRDPEALAATIRRALERGGSVLIPAFAIDRTEILLAELGALMARGALPEVPVLVDSPMALRALEVYRRALTTGGADVRPGVPPPARLYPPTMREIASAQESAAVDRSGTPRIIVSASGMASGGRVVHHLAALLPDPRNLVLLVGFQATGTRGADLLAGVNAVKCLGEYVPVNAEVDQLGWLSVHADRTELVNWLRTAEAPPGACYVVHGEPEASAAFAAHVHRELGWLAVVPREDERVLLVHRPR